ncbi:MAG TPA: hypothetical protein VFW87_23400 [Pirellulales bacterium]|nr:hypothetical protein [Pirellulales bacterium]
MCIIGLQTPNTKARLRKATVCLVALCVVSLGRASAGAADSRDAVTSSPTLRESLHGFDEWLSAQSIYDASQVDQIKADQQRRLASMNTDELADFHRDLDAKLSILSSAEWQETMAWLSSTLSAAAPSYAQQLDLHYPDVARLTAAQLQRALAGLERRRWSEHQESLAFERMRETRLSMHQRQLRADEDARERALDRAVMSNRFSEYHPRHHPAQQRRRRPFYPPYAPFGFGFGFGGFGLF